MIGKELQSNQYVAQARRDQFANGRDLLEVVHFLCHVEPFACHGQRDRGNEHVQRRLDPDALES